LIKVILASNEEEKKACYRMRYEMICQELGWISGDKVSPEERDEYDATQSISFLALDDDGNPIGTSRIILEGDMPFPIERHFKIDPRERIEEVHGKIISVVEASRFIVPNNNNFRHHEVSISMCQALIAKCLDLDISHIFISADYKFYRLTRMTGFPLAKIGEAIHYMGSMTVPSITTTLDWETVLRQKFANKLSFLER
jgi:N-acyl-L-homoserine lactone synthetase